MPISNRTGQTGGMHLMLAVVAVSNVLGFLDAQTVPARHDDRYTLEQKLNAVRWATSLSGEAFDRWMPSAAAAAVRDPTCRITTLRSPGSNDRLDYEITIDERCDGDVAGFVIVPVADSLTNQLARRRLEDPAMPADRALTNAIAIRHISLSNAQARTVLSHLVRLRIPALAANDLFLDARTIEIASNSGSARTLVEVAAVDEGPDRRAVRRLVEQTLQAAGLRDADMLLDASYWSQGDD